MLLQHFVTGVPQRTDGPQAMNKDDRARNNGARRKPGDWLEYDGPSAEIESVECGVLSL